MRHPAIEGLLVHFAGLLFAPAGIFISLARAVVKRHEHGLSVDRERSLSWRKRDEGRKGFAKVHIEEVVLVDYKAI